MAAINVVQRLFHHHDLRAARRALAPAITQQFPLRLLPPLARVPLPLTDATGAPRTIEEALASHARVLVAGAGGSGRRLALQQLALRWLADERAPFPALVTLPLLDDDAAAPQTLLGRWLTRSYPAAAHRLGLPFTGEARASHGTWGLLIDGLDELPAARQRVWRALLAATPPETPLVVAVAADEPAWDAAARLTSAPPTPELCAAWVAQLAPPALHAALHAALDGPLAPLGDRLLDLALLCWVARNGLPSSRATLYERTVRGLLGARPAPTLEELQLLAAYDERPAAPAPGLLDVTATGGLRFVHPRLRDCLAARQLVAEGRYGALAQLAPPARAEIARFAASAAADPAPLYAALWGSGQPTAEDALTLGAALAERPPSAPAWTVRIAAALARLVRAGDDAQRAEATRLLARSAPALDAALAAFARADGQTRPAIMRLLRLLPPVFAAARTERLACAASTPDDLAWELADLLAELPAASSAPPHERAALARWVYVQALASPASRALIAAADAPTLDALWHSTAGDERIVRAAAALAGDAALLPDARAAALTLLGTSQQPSAHSAIAAASRDAHPAVRQAALATLREHSPQQGHAALRQTALDQRAACELRREALRHIARYGDDPALFAACARDGSLPLSLRLECLAALAPSAGGVAQLRDLLRDSALEPAVRAGVARQLGRTPTALPDLLALLADPATPSLISEGICAALASQGSITSVPALLALIERVPTDVDLTLAAVGALGQLPCELAVTPLRDLLTDADERLRYAALALGLRDDAPLDLARLPEPFARRLATLHAEASTAADPPTTIAEFLRREAERLRGAAAQALGALGGDAAQMALRDALMSGATGGATAETIEGLAQTAGPQSAAPLADLLAERALDPLVHWLAVQQLRDHPAGEAVLLRALARSSLDPFTRGALAEALGQRGTTAALPLLRALADDAANDEHLRAQAILALGLLDDPTSEIALLRLLTTTGERATLRGLAAEHLPTALSDEGRRVLRELLRTQRPPEPVAAGVLRALGRLRDREALSLLLRYAQDEAAAVAQAALLALAELDESSVAPVLVRITQNPHTDAATRTQAAGTLLRLNSEHLPLLRVALEQGALPLRLQALEHLLDTRPPLAALLPTLASHATPLPMRLRLFQHCAADADAAPVLLALLADPSDDQHLRGLVATLLARHHNAPATPALAQIAASANEQIGLRLRCVAALGALGALAALDALADDPALPTSVRRRAAQTLIDHAARPVAATPHAAIISG